MGKRESISRTAGILETISLFPIKIKNCDEMRPRVYPNQISSGLSTVTILVDGLHTIVGG